MPAQPDPNADDTAILPLTEGPPLVRPYVSAAVMEYDPEPMPVQDAFATAMLPPVGSPMPAQPIRPQSRPAQAPWQAPMEAPSTAAMPAVPSADEPYDDQQADLGVFAFSGEPGAAPASGGRAERRAKQQAASNRRRWGVIAGASLGLVAVGTGLAMLLTPSQSDNGKLDQALPLPSGTLPDPSASDGPSPSSAPSATASSPAVASPSPVRTSKAPAPSKAPVAVITPSSAPTTAAPSSAAPSPSASPRTLQYGDSGDDVRAMQQMLVTVYCGYVDQSLVTGTFDSRTQQWLSQFQHDAGIRGTERRTTTYGPETRNALQTDAQNPGC